MTTTTNTDTDKLISRREACGRLGVTAPTLTAMLDAGTITRYLGTTKVSAAQIERILQGQPAVEAPRA